MYIKIRVQWNYTERINIINMFKHSVWLQKNKHIIHENVNHYL